MNNKLFYTLSVLACFAYACDNDSGSSGPTNKCQTEQVLAANGICYDNAACADCLETEVCVGGICYDQNSACAKCDADQVCSKDLCYDADDPCASCKENQTCHSGKCVSKTSTCDPACSSTQYCENGKCHDCEVTCQNKCCEDGQICGDNGCEAKTHEITCDNNQTKCGSVCCEENQICDEDSQTCKEKENCPSERLCSEFCCEEGYVCMENECVPDCRGLDLCGSSVKYCCSPDRPVCEDNECKIACEDGTRCGELEDLCCTGDTPVCVNNTCMAACAGTRCGENSELCCDDSAEICIYNKCVKYGNACTKSSMCKFDEICEETNNVCINEDSVESTCQIFPKFDEFKVLKQWHWPTSLPGGKPSTYPNYIKVIVTPLVANLTDDDNDGVIDTNDVPDVVFMSYDRTPDCQFPSVIRVISGDNGHEIASSDNRYWTYPAPMALADIDDDGKVEIIVGTNNNRDSYLSWSPSTKCVEVKTDEANDYLIALSVEEDNTSATGYTLKRKYELQIPNQTKLSFISVANIDAEGYPEILSSQGVASIVEENGVKKLAWREGCHDTWPSADGGAPHAADLDNDGLMELIGSRGIYDNHCKQLLSYSFTGGVGTAIADLLPFGDDKDETGELVPEIATTAGGTNGGSFKFHKIYKTVDASGNATWSAKAVWNYTIPIDQARAKSHNNYESGAGAPVIADFNGDKYPDVGVAARYYYIVYSNDGTSEGGKVLWADGKTVDYSSASTSSSVFDFEGDGKAEVIYGDEQSMHIYTGEGSGIDSDGDGYNDPVHLLKEPNYSATGQEYPIIVDVDNDGSTEILIASDQSTTSGVTAYEDPGGQWVRTRRIWNQHYYHVTNINEDGTVPVKEDINWLHPKLNNFRQNVQPGGVYNAPNLTASALTSDLKCPENLITLTAKVENTGSLGIKAGLSVKFYIVDPNGTTGEYLIKETKVPKAMAPGSSADVSIDWNSKVTINGQEVDVQLPAKIKYVLDEPTPEKAFGEFVECIEDDNAMTKDISGCIEVN